MNVYLVHALETTPLLVDSAFRALPAGSWDTPTMPGRFTPREVVAHLADWEPVMLSRMRQCVDQPGSTLVAYDEGEMAKAHRYHETDPLIQSAAFQAARRETLAWLQGLPTEAWQSLAVHQERGPQSVYDIANTLVCHDVYHVAQLQGLR